MRARYHGDGPVPMFPSCPGNSSADYENRTDPVGTDVRIVNETAHRCCDLDSIVRNAPLASGYTLLRRLSRRWRVTHVKSFRRSFSRGRFFCLHRRRSFAFFVASREVGASLIAGSRFGSQKKKNERLRDKRIGVREIGERRGEWSNAGTYRRNV